MKFNRGDVTGADAATFNDQGWTTVNLPHTFQNLSVLSTSYYRGIGCYRKHFTLGAEQTGRKVLLYFEGAMTVTQVWINGTALPLHKGGFTPFCFDISQYCTFDGSDNVVSVRIDNKLQGDIPPEKADGGYVDFVLFGGLYRDVKLIITDPVYIPDAIHDWSNNFAAPGGQFITFPAVTAASATVGVDTWVKNTTPAAVSCRLATTLVDDRGEIIQSDESTVAVAAGAIVKATQTLNVANPRLWYPWQPVLYTLFTVVYNGAAPVDMYKTKIGIRKLEWTKTTGVFCNGQPFKLIGLNRHQAWPFVGGAAPNVQQRRDAALLKDAGCNFIRCSHYPQDPAFYDACDSLGILLWVEVPTWQGNTASYTQTWRDNLVRFCRTMIKSARNHPSAAIWAAGPNEASLNTAFDKILNDAAHAEDPTRPTTMARNYNANPNTYDIYGGNWFTNLPASNPDPATLGFLNAEHTGHTYETARNATEPTLIEHAARHENMVHLGRQQAWIHGSLGWCAFDYYNGDGAAIKAHGVMDIMHIPKFAYYFYKSQSGGDNYNGSKHPMVFIANYYMAGSPLDRKVFTNCEQVKLYRNNTLVGTMSPDTVADKCAHPSITFANIAFETGELRADGLIGGQVVASCTTRTPGVAARIALFADPNTIEANGSDFSRVIAQVVDANGTVLPTATNSISFTINAAGTLIGANPAAATAGQTIALAQAKRSEGVITVSATSGSLSAGSVSITVKPMPPLETGIVHVSAKLPIRPRDRVKTMIGPRLFVPAEAGRLPMSVTVHDLKGRLCYEGAVKNRVIDLSKQRNVANGVYIVHIRALSPK